MFSNCFKIQLKDTHLCVTASEGLFASVDPMLAICTNNSDQAWKKNADDNIWHFNSGLNLDSWNGVCLYSDDNSNGQRWTWRRNDQLQTDEWGNQCLEAMSSEAGSDVMMNDCRENGALWFKDQQWTLVDRSCN